MAHRLVEIEVLQANFSAGFVRLFWQAHSRLRGHFQRQPFAL
jgi:hypothetical protein